MSARVADFERRIRAEIAAAEARGERYDVTAPDAPITTTPEDAPLTFSRWRQEVADAE